MMVRVLSSMVSLGTKAPDFVLPDVITGNPVKFEPNHAPASVVMFICNHCPFVKHINKALTDLANDYLARGIFFYAINSNDIEKYPEDAPEHMREVAREHQYPFPYLFDETQEVAKAFNAKCTPDFFVYDCNSLLIYRGQLDDSRPGNELLPDGGSIREALNCLLNNKPLTSPQKPSIGCNIKWREACSIN